MRRRQEQQDRYKNKKMNRNRRLTYTGRSPISLENDTEGLFVRCVNCGFVYEKARASHRSATSYETVSEVFFSDGSTRIGTAGIDGMNDGVPLVTMLIQRGIVGLRLDAFESPCVPYAAFKSVHSGGCPLGCLNFRED